MERKEEEEVEGNKKEKQGDDSSKADVGKTATKRRPRELQAAVTTMKSWTHLSC